jgi:DNA modification methylase
MTVECACEHCGRDFAAEPEGGHRLLCGDSTSADAMDRLLGATRVDCVFTSPPYAVGIDYGAYQDSIENLRAMLPGLAALWAGVVAPGGFAVINFSDIAAGSKIAGSDEPCEYPMAVEYWPAFRAAGWTLWTRRIWQKPHARVHSPWAIQSCRAASDWEHLWVWKTPGRAIVARGEHSAFGVWDSSKGHGVDEGKDVHGAGMPVVIAARSLETHSRPGQAVFEPFAGTGTSIIAAEKSGRRCLAMEISPAYCGVAVRRWSKFTGRTAVLADDGRTFDELAEARGTGVAA